MEPSTALLELARQALETAVPNAMSRFLEKRRRASFDILIEELRIANVNPEEAAARDDVAAMFVKYYQAMAQGAAFSNLRLIAKILAGKAADASARSDDFISWTDAIAGLTYEEAALLADMYVIEGLQSTRRPRRGAESRLARRIHRVHWKIRQRR